MENWALFLDSLKKPDPFIYSTITPLNWKIPMVAVKDIGHRMAEELTSTEEQPSSPYVYELQGPRDYDPMDVQAAVAKVIGKHVDLRPIEQDQLPEFYGKLFPPSIVDDWVEMATSFLPGGKATDVLPPENERDIVRGSTELLEAIQDAVRKVW